MPFVVDKTDPTIELMQAPDAEATPHDVSSTVVHTPEQELTDFINRGDFELIGQLPAFQKRSPESKVQILRTAIDHRIAQINQCVGVIVNRPSFCSAAMGMLQRIHQLRRLRDEILRSYYEQQGQRQIGDQAGVKIDFY